MHGDASSSGSTHVRGDVSNSGSRQQQQRTTPCDDENRATKVGNGVVVANRAAAMARSGQAAVAPGSHGDRDHESLMAKKTTCMIFKATRKPLTTLDEVQLISLTLSL